VQTKQTNVQQDTLMDYRRMEEKTQGNKEMKNNENVNFSVLQ
jgi:hypothetical protein